MLKVFVSDEVCKGCGLCITVCPKKILRLSGDKINGKGYVPAECVDQNKCITCTFCAIVCPDMAIEINGE